jgi:hypothetical protein
MRRSKKNQNKWVYKKKKITKKGEKKWQ